MRSATLAHLRAQESGLDNSETLNTTFKIQQKDKLQRLHASWTDRNRRLSLRAVIFPDGQEAPDEASGAAMLASCWGKVHEAKEVREVEF
eukprot:2027471-Pyramimonas_sp.AAC.1